MKNQVVRSFLMGCLATGVIAGCGTPRTNADAGRRPPTATRPAITSSKGMTPPTGAMSKGMAATKPMLMTKTVPLSTNVEYFSFMFTPEGTTTAVEAFWAYDATATPARNYIWWTENDACASTGTATPTGYIVEVNADGSGGFLLTSTCGDLDTAGCTFTADGTATCGACSLDGTTGLVTCTQ